MAMALQALQAGNFHNLFAVSCGGEPVVIAGDKNAPQPASCAFDSVSEEMLDSGIWSNLPESVLHLVFSKLPLKSLVRIRCLNKLWMSACFFSNGAEYANYPGRFALLKGGPKLPCDQQEVWVFDTPAQEWCKFRLGRLIPSSPEFRGPFAVAGGLLCYISETSSRSRTLEVLVANPVTRTWQLLPPSLNLREFPTLTHMSLKQKFYSITLVGLCEESGALVIEVYDSKSNAWCRAHSPLQMPSTYYNLFKGDDYLGLATVDKGSRNVKRLMYPAALQKSSFLNRYEDKCWILESGGSLFMCSNAPRREGVWQRRESSSSSSSSEWNRVCGFPVILKKYEKTSLYLSENVVLLVGSEPRCFPPQLEDLDPHKIVMLDNVTHQWSILPRISSQFGTMDDLVAGLIMFEPRFDTKP